MAIRHPMDPNSSPYESHGAQPGAGAAGDATPQKAPARGHGRGCGTKRAGAGWEYIERHKRSRASRSPREEKREGKERRPMFLNGGRCFLCFRLLTLTFGTPGRAIRRGLRGALGRVRIRLFLAKPHLPYPDVDLDVLEEHLV